MKLVFEQDSYIKSKQFVSQNILQIFEYGK